MAPLTPRPLLPARMQSPDIVPVICLDILEVVLDIVLCPKIWVMSFSSAAWQTDKVSLFACVYHYTSLSLSLSSSLAESLTRALSRFAKRLFKQLEAEAQMTHDISFRAYGNVNNNRCIVYG